ncbi:terminase large subunit domain-containing protein [Rhodococcus erythropolis]|uniref:terminase large subunit domain-containing protein n=1 Tax=Rhodococcus erythropolis TaxID=1833 RepID=UPI00406BCA05
MTSTLDGLDVQRLIDDPAYFAEKAIGEPLWDYQSDFARSQARYRVMCAGRQVGKSRLLAVIALHTAYVRANVNVLVISNGEDASKRIIADCHYLTSRSDLLKGSVLDDKMELLTLKNGSTIASIPASDARARGDSIDLLIVDEAGFIKESLWQAAEPTILARPGSRVILASTPWGKSTHFFRQHYTEGMETPSEDVAAWHWPSSISPIADQSLIEKWRRTWSSIKFRTEILAEWVNDAGAYFTMEELDNAVADYELLDPANARGELSVGGIDWGFANDANCVVFLSALSNTELNADNIGEDVPIFYVSWLEAHHRMQYSEFIDRLTAIGRTYRVSRYISECNGVGQMPSQVLFDKMYKQSLRDSRWATSVFKVTTDLTRKANGFGRIKVLLQQGRLVLPRHTELLKQLHALEYEMTPTGLLRIAVPEIGGGHDDLAMALLQAVSSAGHGATAYPGNRTGSGPILETGFGTKIHQKPAANNDEALFYNSPKKV